MGAVLASGVLVIDKPKGPTSFDVVRDVRKALGAKKAGHTGTLDPMATGVLAVCLGNATRIAQYLIDGDKAYDAVVRLGVTTDTFDAQGQVQQERPVPNIDRPMLEAVLAQFRGTRPQLPPMYSAVKVGGKRLYELARAGEEVEREAREITVHSLELRDFSATELQLSVRASKGFFVRTLASELGEALGCGAHLTALRRTMSGPFSLANAITLEAVLASPTAALEKLTSEHDALRAFPEVQVSAEAAARVLNGVQFEATGPDRLVRVVGPTGDLLALADVERGRLKYRRVLARDE